MPQPLVVPTIFTAVDRLSGVVQRMQRSVGGFAGKASIGVNALNNGINSLLPSFGKLAKQALTFGAGYAIFSGLRAGGDALVDFEKNVAGLRVILDDLSDGQFEPYKKQIISVARATRVSAVDVASSFEKIAELNFDLAKTPDGLARIATSAITLARAARLELTPATEGLIAIMSQFEVPAEQADRLSNALAAGFKFGSASIEDQIESYRGFGTVAKEANVTMEQSIALTQTLAKYQLKGSEAGTALRSAIIHLQNAGAGYKSGIFSLNDALDEMRKKLAGLKNDKSRDAFLNALFGIRAVTQGRLLGRSADLMKDLTENVSGTQEAFKQASITTETFASRWEQLKGAIETYLVSNNSAQSNLDSLKKVIVYVADNLDRLVGYLITGVNWYIHLKLVIWGVKTALFAYNVVLGVTGAVTGLANIAIAESAVAMAAYRTSLLATTAALWTFNVAKRAVIGSIAANAGGSIFATAGNWVVALGAIGAAIGIVISFVSELRRNWEALTSSFISDGIGAGFKKLGAIFVSSLLTPMARFMTYIGKLTGWKWATDQVAENNRWQVKNGLTPFSQEGLEKNKLPTIPSPMTNFVNSQNSQNQLSSTKQWLGIDITAPGSLGVSTIQKGPATIPVKVTPTTGIK